MAQLDTTIAIGKGGMNRDTHPMGLTETDYTFANNAVYENENGDGFPVLQNEPSNLLCTRFKEGYQVIGYAYDLIENQVYYALTNPETGASEIGVVTNYEVEDLNNDTEVDCGCNTPMELGDPLDEEQVASCTYETIIQDTCDDITDEYTGCLNFDVNHPIKQGNMIIKEEKCGKTLYWTDGYNPPRRLVLSDLEQYEYIGTSTCGEPLEQTCLDCDKLRIFPKFYYGCIEAEEIEYGGSLEQGMYEFLIAWCDKAGNERSSYFSITNPIHIFDKNNVIQTQSEQARITNLGIRLSVTNIDQQFGYYKVAVIQRADVNAATSYFIEGVHSVTDSTVLYYTSIDKQRTTLEHLTAIKPSYLTTDILTESNGYLFQAGLEAHRELNLQPVVSLMSAFLRWQTVKSTEELYENGVNTSKYKGYMRDEVYPFSFRFKTNTGYITSNFVCVNRPPTEEELEIVASTDTASNNDDVNSILEYTPSCSDNDRKYRWQYYNTATEVGYIDPTAEEVAKKDLKCKPQPHKYGKFGYYESIENYPDNEELYDSSNLVINSDEIPESIKSEFEEYFVDSEDSGNYVLNDYTKLLCNPIRHYRFPDHEVAPFIEDESDITTLDNSKLSSFETAYIYPIGVTIDNEVVNYFLDLAVTNELITQEERDSIVSYEIFRGDRTLSKSILAKGLAYDMYKYESQIDEEEDSDNPSITDIYYSNYPYNDLRDDKLHYTNTDRDTLISHPHGGTENDRFTFHSPDVHFRKPFLPSEIKVEAYQSGASRGRFTTMEDHSKWVILSSSAYTAASALAALEVAFDMVAQYGDFRVQNAIAADRHVQGGYWDKVRKKTDLDTDANFKSNSTDLSTTTSIPTILGTFAGPTNAGEFTSFPATANSSGSFSTDNNYSASLNGTEEENYDNYGTVRPLDQTTIDKIGFLNVTNPTKDYDRPEIDRADSDDGLNYEHYDENTERLSAVEKVMIMTGILESSLGTYGQKRYEWLKYFKESGQPENFAYYYSSEGYYNRAFKPKGEGNSVRGLLASKYLNSGLHRVLETNATSATLVNNYDRESSVYLATGKYPLEHIDKTLADNFRDTSRIVSSDIGDGAVIIDVEEEGEDIEVNTYEGTSAELETTILAPYVSLKNYTPSQYGEVDSIKWLNTGYCGNIETNETPLVFGGDIFISRFSLKRKLPIFKTTSHGVADLTPFNYSPYVNIAQPVYFCNYDVADVNTINIADIDNVVLDFLLGLLSLGLDGQPMPAIKSEYNFDTRYKDDLYIKPPSKFYTSYYGIPQFLVESEINCNCRYAGRELADNFYPNVGDYLDWTQESNVSIKRDNTYLYNETFSKSVTQLGNTLLPSSFEQELYDCLYDAPNGVIYSMQDTSEQDITDPWLVYKPLDKYQFPTEAGRIIDLKGIESTQVLGRFENQLLLFNAIDHLAERLTPSTNETGTGGIFATRPLEFKKTSLGYSGTQSKEMVSCEFGHFWVDAKRGQVFKVDQNGQNLQELSSGMRNWLKEHLPFKILKGVSNVTSRDTDNPYNGLGITMGWDSRFKRVLITKKDYRVQADYRNRITYEDFKFYVDKDTDEELEISLLDSTYFEDASFTIGYSPITESWLSYYSYKPNFYVNFNDFYQTGVNISTDDSELGVWSHLKTNKSYQVYYGKLYDFTVEVPSTAKYSNKVASNVEYWLDARRYHNEYDYAENKHIGFNKAWVYNENNNSGQLNLITQKENDLSQHLKYPKYYNTSTDILATPVDRHWNFNFIYNKVKDNRNNQPIWINDVNQIDKYLNPKALQMTQTWLDRLRGEWFKNRLTIDNESRYKIMFKWLNNDVKYY